MDQSAGDRGGALSGSLLNDGRFHFQNRDSYPTMSTRYQYDSEGLAHLNAPTFVNGVAPSSDMHTQYISRGPRTQPVREKPAHTLIGDASGNQSRGRSHHQLSNRNEAETFTPAAPEDQYHMRLQARRPAHYRLAGGERYRQSLPSHAGEPIIERDEHVLESVEADHRQINTVDDSTYGFPSSHTMGNDMIRSADTYQNLRKAYSSSMNLSSNTKTTGTRMIAERREKLVTIDVIHKLFITDTPKSAKDLLAWLELTGWHNVELRNAPRNASLARHRDAVLIEAQRQEMKAMTPEPAALDARRAQIQQVHEHDVRSQHLQGAPLAARADSFSVPVDDKLRSVAANNDRYTNGDNMDYEAADQVEEQQEYNNDDFSQDIPYARSVVSNGSRDRSASPRDVNRSADREYRGRESSEVSYVRDETEKQASPVPERAPTPGLLADRITQPGPMPQTGLETFAERREYPKEREQQQQQQVVQNLGYWLNNAPNAPYVPERNMQRENRHRVMPKSLNLGSKGDTRFFAMKSYNFDNIYDCQDEGIWATQAHNEDNLGDVWCLVDNIILFFAANQSRSFSGYARMTTAPSPDCARPRWWNKVNSKKIKMTSPFQVEWINTIHCDNWHMRYLRNALNEDLPLNRLMDGQEIDDATGRAMVAILDEQAVKELGS